MSLLSGAVASVAVYLVLGLVLGVVPSGPVVRPVLDRRAARWRTWLDEAGVRVAPTVVVAVSAGIGGLVATSVWALVGVVPLALVAGAVAAVLPSIGLVRRRRERREAIVRAWPDALRDLAGHLNPGRSLHASLVELGRSGPSPLRPSFARYATLADALDPEMALDVVRDELADPVSDRVITVVIVAFEQGSAVVIDIIDQLAEATTNDLRLIEEIRTLQLETTLEARGAAVLPFVVLGLLCVTTPGYRAFYDTPVGWAVVAIGLVVSGLGVVVIQRLGSIPADVRVLTDRTRP